jgi:serine/threonine-protein kinase HipA
MPTSEGANCFVYLQLPGSLETVTCGRLTIAHGVGRFVYRRKYVDDPRAVELDKFELPIRAGTFETARLKGVFGALRDAAPDAWGRRVIERQLKTSGLDELAYLLHSPEDRAGALSFGRGIEPPPPVQAFNKVLQLEALMEQAARIEADLPVPDQISSLVMPGTSMGGARPKNVVEDHDGLWLAKFPSRNDRWTNAPVEAGMLELARWCGLHSAEARVTQVGRGSVLLVKRFDRAKADGGYHRHRMVSALTVLRSDEDVQARANWSYVSLADELRRWVISPDEDLHELFGRMVFNALISNLDDHPRNHAVLGGPHGWRLAPAYDLNPSPVVSADQRDLAMEVGTRGRWANRENCLSQAMRFRLSREVANARIDQIRSVVIARWAEAVRKHGATERDCEQIAAAFTYPGFEYPG